MLSIIAGILDINAVDSTEVIKKLKKDYEDPNNQNGLTEYEDPENPGFHPKIAFEDDFLLWLLHMIKHEVNDHNDTSGTKATDVADLVCCHHNEICNHCGCG